MMLASRADTPVSPLINRLQDWETLPPRGVIRPKPVTTTFLFLPTIFNKPMVALRVVSRGFQSYVIGSSFQTDNINRHETH
mmetsp:Transcript_6122/g.7041  ORF Transcript_6122/g.7041 Transcript_6122/m.7041 type:complete len:81 (-) Transcript_6122:73-315(-)